VRACCSIVGFAAVRPWSETDGAVDHVVDDGEGAAGAGHRRLAAHHLLQERQVVVLGVPQRHRHGRRRRAQPALRHVRARMVRSFTRRRRRRPCMMDRSLFQNPDARIFFSASVLPLRLMDGRMDRSDERAGAPAWRRCSCRG
jgi:hypothetical protein